MSPDAGRSRGLHAGYARMSLRRNLIPRFQRSILALWLRPAARAAFTRATPA